MSDEQRDQVSGEQEALVRALVGAAPPPPTFDADRVTTAAASLVGKRAREVADSWPQLARCLGPRLTERFLDWADSHPVPTGISNPWADGLAFQLAEVSSSELDTDAIMERQRGRAQAVVRRSGGPGTPAKVRRRRGPLLLVKRSRSRRAGRRRTIITLTVTPDHVRTWCIPRR